MWKPATVFCCALAGGCLQAQCPAEFTPQPPGPLDTPARVRAYGWKLFSAVIQEVQVPDHGAMPLWETWYGKKEALQPDADCSHKLAPAGRDFQPIVKSMPSNPKQGSARTSPSSRRRPGRAGIALFRDRMAIEGRVGDVVFNHAAFHSIQDNRFFDPKQLDKLLANLPQGTPVRERTLTLNDDSVIVKAAWYCVRGESQNQVPYWRAASHPEDTIAAPAIWDQKICISTPDKGCPENIPSRSVAAFHSFRIDSDGAFFNVPPSGLKKASDYMALVGFHVLARIGLSTWFWATFWWDPDPEAGEYAQGRPDSLRGTKWGNYLMRTTISMDGPAFNPYIEPSQTANCVRCHAFAARPQLFKDKPVGNPDLGDAKLFGDKLRTDFLWTIALNK